MIWPVPDPLSWTLIAVFLFLSFFFSAAETGLASCNRFKMQIKADNGSHNAKIVLKLIDKFDRALTTVLIGHNLVTIACSAISTLLFLGFFTQYMDESWASIICSIIMAFVVYLLGDTLPKTIARAIPDTVSLATAYPIYGLGLILYPIVLAFEGIGKLIDKIFAQKKEAEFSEEDFENTVEQVTDEGVLEEEQQEMIQSALEFSSIPVKKVFTPLEKMVMVDIDGLTHESLQEKLADITYSRIPVYKKDYDHFVGVLLVKNYTANYLKNPATPIRKSLVKPYFVQQSIRLDDLFRGFKKHHTHCAFVTNTAKKVIGMVTMEDVLEELIPDIGEPRVRRKRRSS